MTGMNKQDHGFTLIEIVVAIGIFSVVVILVVSAMSRSSFQQRRQIAEQAVQEDMRLALEVFSREARLAYGNTFYADSGDNPFIEFANQYNQCVRYSLNTAEYVLYRSEGGPAGGTDCSTAVFDPDTSQPLINPDNTKVNKMSFQVTPATWVGSADTKDDLTSQGYITVVLEVEDAHFGGQPFLLQTTISSHQVNRNAESNI